MARTAKKATKSTETIEQPVEEAVELEDQPDVDAVPDDSVIEADILITETEDSKLDGPRPGEETDEELLEGIPETELAAVAEMVVPPKSSRSRRVAKARNHRSGDGGVTMLTGDPVRMYLKEIGNFTLISSEDEVKLAKRINKGRAAVLIIKGENCPDDAIDYTKWSNAEVIKKFNDDINRFKNKEN